jgi:cytochrome c-type biogenesis protein
MTGVTAHKGISIAIVIATSLLALASSVAAEGITTAGNTGDVPFLIAVLAGFISVLSPCSVPLLIGYLAAISKDEKSFWPRTLSFFAGLSAVWMLLGFGASGLGSLIAGNGRMLYQIAGVMMIGFGATYLLDLRIPSVPISRKVDMTILGMFIFGCLFTLAWIPCVSPILGGILAIAATGNALQGGILLLFYALGFMLAVLAIFFVMKSGGRAIHINKGIKLGKKEHPLYNIIAGVFLIIMGIIYFTNTIEPVVVVLLPISGAVFSFELWVQENSTAAGFAVMVAVVALVYYIIMKENKVGGKGHNQAKPSKKITKGKSGPKSRRSN